MAKEIYGALIDQGPTDWQILQRNTAGTGEIHLQGRWRHTEPGQVQVRLVHQDTGTALSAALDWQTAETRADGTWSAQLQDIPAGGLYRLETRFQQVSQPDAEWSARGDMRHFLGVGDLWVIAGQSNSAGYGRGPYHDPPELGVHLFRTSEQWALATHPMNESTQIRPGRPLEDANPGHSPYLHFGRILRRTLNVPIGLVQTALGGTPLRRWNPADKEDPDLYENMIRCIQAVGGRVTGILWYQGESDTDKGPEVAARYAERFVAAVQAWRERLQAPALPVLTVQLNRFHSVAGAQTERNWSLVREAQRRVPQLLGGVAVVPSGDLPLSDAIHTSPAGNLVLGERMARAALGLAYDQPAAYRAPEPVAGQRSSDGTKIEVRFAPVTSQINHLNPLAKPFQVQDQRGPVAVRQVVYPKNATVTLVLERALEGAATLDGGYGLAAELLPMDIERQLPVLAFLALPVQ